MLFSFFKKKKNKDVKKQVNQNDEQSRVGTYVTAVATAKNDESLPEILPANKIHPDGDDLKDLVFEYSFSNSSLYLMYKEWFEKNPKKDDDNDIMDIYSFINHFVNEVTDEPELSEAPNKSGIEIADNLIDYIDDCDDDEKKSALDEISKNTDIVDEESKNSSNVDIEQPSKENNHSDKELSKDPCIWCFVSDDKLRAYIVILPKRKKALAPTFDRIIENITQMGITTGVDEKLIKKIVNKKLFFQLFVVARGKDKIDGVDGKVIEHYPRKIKIVLKEDEFGNTDYKNLGNVKNIAKGSVICDIILPTKGSMGYNVYGEEIPCKDGEMPIIPMGENTNLTDDELHLVASCDGCVNYHDGMFYVRQLLYIKGNVDPHTGNVSFKGDIIIEGDVMEGYDVHADGNLRIQGTVENSSLSAGGGISITGGVKGNEKAVLTSGSEIKSLFLESCTVKAKNGVYSESIINSSIYTDDCVSVDRGRGIIIGGTFVARHYVQAKAIGNQSGKICVIKLGTNYNIAEEKAQLSRDLDQLEKDLRSIKKDLLFFDRNTVALTSEKKEQYSALKSKAGLYANQIRIKQKKLNEIINHGFDISECFVRAKECFPPINLTIGSHNTVIRMPYFSSKCYFSSSKEEFRIVNYNDEQGNEDNK